MKYLKKMFFNFSESIYLNNIYFMSDISFLNTFLITEKAKIQI